MTTLETLAAYVSEQDAACGKWIALADDLVSRKVADARAHAGRALTDALRSTPDGRQTIAKVRNSSSYLAAVHRLAELADSLRGLVGRARIDFYRDAFAWHAKHIPEPMRRSKNPIATQANIDKAAAISIHGELLSGSLRSANEMAARGLLSTVSQIGSLAVPEKAAFDMLDAWERRTRDAVGQSARTLMSDSQIIIDRKAGRDVICPDYLLPDPTLP